MRTIICASCNQPFTTRRAEATYCSRRCSGQARQGVERPALQDRLLKTCENCGEAFLTGGNTHKLKSARFCSRRCAGEARQIKKTCERCGQPFHRHAGRGRFCSRDCADAQARGGGSALLDLTCLRCGKAFQRYQSLVRNPARVYCSNSCRTAGRVYARGEDNPLWKGGAYVARGHRYVVDHTRPPKPSGGYPYITEHVKIAREVVGRPLTDQEHVHHLNGDGLDNRPENFLLMTGAAHRALHAWYAQQFQREHAARGDILELSRAFLDTIGADYQWLGAGTPPAGTP